MRGALGEERRHTARQLEKSACRYGDARSALHRSEDQQFRS